MTLRHNAFWHKESYHRLMTETLPQLLTDRLPVVNYQYEATGVYTSRVTLTFTTGHDEFSVVYDALPQPDDDGFFTLDGKPGAILPIASHEDLAAAEIDCVGEQMYRAIESRLGTPPADLPWDADLARAWLPLDEWLIDYLRAHIIQVVSPDRGLDEVNWLERTALINVILIPDWQQAWNAGHYGRVCPFEMPEGPNIGRVLRVAAGAEIRQRRLVITDDRPDAAISFNSRMIPFLEHNDPNRLLMGVNMMRQWLVPPTPEPALVQTGHEPDAPDFWCGRNLLTAFMAWGGDTFEDGIVVSQSGARRLGFPHAIEPGDKLSTRHGNKGVVSRILPDTEMPQLPDGRPVEIIFNFIGLPGRFHTGQLKEAVMGLIAEAEGKPALVPPFHAPSQQAMQDRLKASSLPEDGMTRVLAGANGRPLTRTTTVGWVYWGRLVHTAASKIQAAEDGPGTQRQGPLEYFLLRDLGAYEILQEHFNTRSSERPDSDSLGKRVAAGPVPQAEGPTPFFSDLQARLALAGISATLTDAGLTFSLTSEPASAATSGLQLARPVPHPWLPGPAILAQGGVTHLDDDQIADLLAMDPAQISPASKPPGRGHLLTYIGIAETAPAYTQLAETNRRLAGMVNSQTPQSLLHKTYRQLVRLIGQYFEQLLRPEHLQFWNRVGFSGRAVITPDAHLTLSQISLPDTMAWTLFGPQVTQALGDEAAVQAQNDQAAQMLDQIMAQSWVLLNRTPSFTATAMLAFQPLRNKDRVIRVHPLICDMLNADFDGDQAAVFLPLTEAGQKEAAEIFSVAGHLQRDPGLVASLCAMNEAIWGLAELSRTAEGRADINKIASLEISMPDGILTRAALTTAMERMLAQNGVDQTLKTIQRLMQRGFAAVSASGASQSAFLGSSLDRSAKPLADDRETWLAYVDSLAEQLAARTDFDDPDLGVQLLAARCSALRQVPSTAMMALLGRVVGVPIQVSDIAGEPVIIQEGYSEGLTASALLTQVAESRAELFQVVKDIDNADRQLRQGGQPQSFNVLGRACRAKHPGFIFAQAAATGEVDPLTDIDSRLLVGLSANVE